MLTAETAPRLFSVFRARHVSTSLRGAACVDLKADPVESLAMLDGRRFDQAPVTRQGHVAGWLRTSSLRKTGSVKASLKPLEESAIVSAAASMSQVLELLGGHGFVFTVDGNLSGFVTPSDLDRHAARSHFYLLISSIEMLLAELVREGCSAEVVEHRIVGSARDTWESARAHSAETDPTEYLYLQDLSELFLETLGDTPAWRSQLSSRLAEICQFRTVVMHPTRSLTAGRSASQLASLARGAGHVSDALTKILCAVEPSDATAAG